MKLSSSEGALQPVRALSPLFDPRRSYSIVLRQLDSPTCSLILFVKHVILHAFGGAFDLCKMTSLQKLPNINTVRGANRIKWRS